MRGGVSSCGAHLLCSRVTLDKASGGRYLNDGTAIWSSITQTNQRASRLVGVDGIAVAQGWRSPPPPPFENVRRIQ